MQRRVHVLGNINKHSNNVIISMNTIQIANLKLSSFSSIRSLVIRFCAMALRRAFASCASPLVRSRCAPVALSRVRTFRSDGSQGANATAPDAEAADSTKEQIATRRVSFAEPSGDPPPAPRRVTLDADGTVIKDDTSQSSGVPSLTVQQAVASVKANATGKFDETIDIAVRLGIDPKRSDMIVRGAANLPHGTGKKITICVFAEDEFADDARVAGADIIGGTELINEIKAQGASAINFDKAIAHPSIMPKLSAVARILGPRGMMPNPKLGTLTTDITKAVVSMKAGRVEFRAEKNAIVHATVGKASFDEKKLQENVEAFMAVIMDLRPRAVKGAPSATNYLKGASLSSTMGKGSHRISKESLVKAAADGAARAKDV